MVEDQAGLLGHIAVEMAEWFAGVHVDQEDHPLLPVDITVDDTDGCHQVGAWSVDRAVIGRLIQLDAARDGASIGLEHFELYSRAQLDHRDRALPADEVAVVLQGNVGLAFDPFQISRLIEMLDEFGPQCVQPTPLRDQRCQRLGTHIAGQRLAGSERLSSHALVRAFRNNEPDVPASPLSDQKVHHDACNPSGDPFASRLKSNALIPNGRRHRSDSIIE